MPVNHLDLQEEFDWYFGHVQARIDSLMKFLSGITCRGCEKPRAQKSQVCEKVLVVLISSVLFANHGTTKMRA